jgi:hypothetical protein
VPPYEAQDVVQSESAVHAAVQVTPGSVSVGATFESGGLLVLPESTPGELLSTPPLSLPAVESTAPSCPAASKTTGEVPGSSTLVAQAGATTRAIAERMRVIRRRRVMLILRASPTSRLHVGWRRTWLTPVDNPRDQRRDDGEVRDSDSRIEILHT